MTSTKPVFHKVLSCLLPLALSACTNSLKEIDEVTNRSKIGEDHGQDVTVIYSTGGKVKARLFAHTFIRNEGANPPYTDMKDGMKAEFFNDSAVVKSTVTARYGRYYELERNVLLRDSVHIVNDKGAQLYTQDLVWNQRLQQFFTEKPVRIVTPTQILFGTGLVASQDFSDFSILHPKGSVQVEKSQLPQ